MASPGSIAASDDASKPVEQITFRFCSECSNMLYPKEDTDNHKLQFTCRTCHYTEEATSTCVFRNVMNTSAGETAGVTQDVGSDPTVGDPCAARSALPPEICLCCGQTLLCTICQQPSDGFTVTALSCADRADPGHGSDTEETRQGAFSLHVDIDDFALSGYTLAIHDAEDLATGYNVHRNMKLNRLVTSARYANGAHCSKSGTLSSSPTLLGRDDERAA